MVFGLVCHCVSCDRLGVNHALLPRPLQFISLLVGTIVEAVAGVEAG